MLRLIWLNNYCDNKAFVLDKKENKKCKMHLRYAKKEQI